MNDPFPKLYGAAKDLITYIDKEEVFDRAAAGGCSGWDFHQSDAFYDLIVKTRGAIAEVEGEVKTEASNAASVDKNRVRERSLRLLDTVKALATHLEQERAFDKVSDLGPVGIETSRSDAFTEVIKKANDAIEETESGLE